MVRPQYPLREIIRSLSVAFERVHIVKRLLRSALAAVLLLGVLAGATAAADVDVEDQRYIVVLKEEAADVGDVADELTREHGGDVDRVFRHALRGFSATLSRAGAEALARNPRVAYVEEDLIRSINAQTTPTGVERIFAAGNSAIGIDGTDDFRVDVDIAIIDTGIDFEHPDLNVLGGVNCARNGGCVDGGDDDHYHGTHVAGTAAALDNGDGVVGVAPGARLWSVKVLNRRGFGTTSWIIAGIDWVAANAGTIEVANMSLGGPGFTQSEYDAVQGAVNAGVAFAVAAGNDSADANGYSPASFDNALTVSAIADFDGAPGALGGPFCDSDQDDTLAWYSNYGSAVGIAAPGSCIYSTFPIESGSYGTISGTSMASPHVAGALALLASADNPNNAADVTSLYSEVISSGNFDWVDDSGDGIFEPLLDVTGFVPVLVATGGGGDEDPTVSISSPASGSSFTSGDSVTFVAAATDDQDGDLTADIEWSSDVDGVLGTGGSVNASLSDGTHVVTASVVDSDSNAASDSVTVTLQVAGGGDFTLTAVAIGGSRQTTELTWSGADGRAVEVYRDGVVLRRTANDGFYTDRFRDPASGTFTYQVCEEGTTVCSNEATVTH